MKWNYKNQWLGEMGAGLPTAETLEGLKIRQREEEKRREEQRLKAEFARKKQAAELTKKQQDAVAAQAKADAKRAADEAAVQAKRDAADRKRQAKASSSAPSYTPAPVYSPSPSSFSMGDTGGAIGGIIKFVLILAVIGWTITFVKWMHAKVAASLFGVFGLTGIAPAAVVIALGWLLPLIAGFVIYDRWRTAWPIWTKGFIWTCAVPTGIFTGFMLLSFLLI